MMCTDPAVAGEGDSITNIKKSEKNLFVACTLSQVSSSIGEVGEIVRGDARKEALVENRKRKQRNTKVST